MEVLVLLTCALYFISHCHRGLAYRSYKHLPLYLEWAPLGLVSDSAKKNKDLDPATTSSNREQPIAAEKIAENGEENNDKDYATLFVKNLKFSSSEDNLRDHLSRLGVLPVQSGGSVRAVSIVKKMKVDCHYIHEYTHTYCILRS